MKFTVETSEFSKAVRQVSKAIKEKNRIPVLNHIAMKVTEGGLVMEGTDLDIGIKKRIFVEVIGEGSLTVSAKKLNKICDLSHGDITFSEKGGKVTVKTGGSKYTLASLEYTDYPLLPEVEGKSIIVPQAVLKNLISKTNHAVANQDIRPAMCGILFELLDTSFSMAATDGHRLSVFDHPIGFDVGKSSSILPLKTALSLLKLLDDSKDVEITFGKDKIKLTMEDMEITSTLIDSQFPSFRRIIPVKSRIEFRIGRIPFIESIKKSVLVDDDTVKKTIISLSENCLTTLSSSKESGEQSEDVIQLVYSGDSINIGMNASYVLDALEAASGEVVSVHLNSDVESMLIESENGLHKQVIMPMRN